MMIGAYLRTAPSLPSVPVPVSDDNADAASTTAPLVCRVSVSDSGSDSGATPIAAASSWSNIGVPEPANPHVRVKFSGDAGVWLTQRIPSNPGIERHLKECRRARSMVQIWERRTVDTGQTPELCPAVMSVKAVDA